MKCYQEKKYIFLNSILRSFDLKSEQDANDEKRNGLNKARIENEFEELESIREIEYLMDKFIQSDKDIFYIKYSKIVDNVGGRIYKNMEHYLLDDKYPSVNKNVINFYGIEKIKRAFPIHQFNPIVLLFIKKMESYFLKDFEVRQYIYYNGGDDNQTMHTLKALNEFVDDIRNEVKSKEFKRTIREFNRKLDKNYNGLTDYIDGLFKIHSRLLVIRVDLSYKKNQFDHALKEDERERMYFQAKNDRELFFKKIKKLPLFKNMLGYAWKLQYGLEKGFHYHMIFFYDGSKSCQDSTIAMSIGEFWNKELTGGIGLYYNYNGDQSSYFYKSIGSINYHDHENIFYLKKWVASYLTKTDYYTRVIVRDNDRTFGKGQLKKTVSNQGRPRKKKLADPVDVGLQNLSN